MECMLFSYAWLSGITVVLVLPNCQLVRRGLGVSQLCRSQVWLRAVGSVINGKQTPEDISDRGKFPGWVWAQWGENTLACSRLSLPLCVCCDNDIIASMSGSLMIKTHNNWAHFLNPVWTHSLQCVSELLLPWLRPQVLPRGGKAAYLSARDHWESAEALRHSERAHRIWVQEADFWCHSSGRGIKVGSLKPYCQALVCLAAHGIHTAEWKSSEREQL